MDRALLLAVALGFSGGILAFAASVSITPGSTVVPGNNTTVPVPTDVVGGTSGGDFTHHFSVDTVVVDVGTFLDFFYEIGNLAAAGSNFDLTQVTIAGLSPITSGGAVANNTGAFVFSSPGNIAAGSANLNPAGDAITFGGFDVSPGTRSEWFELDTHATTFVMDATETITASNGAELVWTDVARPGPSPVVPEPAPVSLFGGGLAFLGVALWRERHCPSSESR